MLPSTMKLNIHYHVKCLIFLLSFDQFKPNLDFIYRFSWKSPVSNFTDILPMRTALIHADRQTDMTQLISSSRVYANAPNNWPVSDTGCVLVTWAVLVSLVVTLLKPVALMRPRSVAQHQIHNWAVRTCISNAADAVSKNSLCLSLLSFPTLAQCR